MNTKQMIEAVNAILNAEELFGAEKIGTSIVRSRGYWRGILQSPRTRREMQKACLDATLRHPDLPGKLMEKRDALLAILIETD